MTFIRRKFPHIPADRVVVGCCVAVGIIALTVLIGWQFNIVQFKQILPSLISMKVNTAIGMALLAVANFIFRREDQDVTKSFRALGLFCSVLAIAIGLATLLEYGFVINLHIDELFYDDIAGVAGHFPPGRLAPVTALLLILQGVSQQLVFRRGHAFHKLAQLLTLVSFVIAFQALVSYAFGITYSFGGAFYTQIALHTTVLAILNCVAFLASRKRHGWTEIMLARSPAGTLSRNLLFWAILVPPIVLWCEITGERLGLLNVDFGGVFRAAGNMIFFVAMVLKNAAELHESETDKKRSEEKFRTVTELSPQIIWTATPDGQIDYCNERWFSYTGLSLEQTRTQGWQSVLHPDDKDRTLSKWITSVSSGATYEHEYRFLRAEDKTYRWHLTRAMPMRNDKGQIIKWFGASTDIEEQKRAEKQKFKLESELQAAAAIQTSEARLRAIFDAAFDGIAGMDDRGLITNWNLQCERIFGWTAQEAASRPYYDMIIPLEDRAAHREGLTQFLIAGRGAFINEAVEITALRKNGERFPIRISITNIQSHGAMFFTAFIEDITDRKNNERDLVIAREKALDAVATKSMFLANMSHEIRTPLNGIVGITDLLLDTQLDNQQAKYSNMIQELGNALLAIINDILDFSKVDAGKMTLEIISFDPGKLLEFQSDLFTMRAKEKGLDFKVDADRILPSLMGDAGRIGQIITNLVSNAIKFTAKGVVELKLGIIQRKDVVPTLEFSVRDSGIGMTDEQRLELFKPFVQADGSTTRKFGGTGLGLSICKQLVELMNGEIEVSSKQGEGATFKVRIPLALAPETIESESSPIEAPTPLPILLSESIRVIVAEDNQINQMVTLAQLKKLGCHVQAFANGREACDAFETGHFDIIFMDCQMPELDGFEATRIIRQREATSGNRPIPIIALTANALEEDREKCMQAGMNDFLSKPTKQATLQAMLVKWLSNLKSKAN